MAAPFRIVLGGIFRKLARRQAARAARRITPRKFGTASGFISAVRRAGGRGGSRRLRVFWKVENNRRLTANELEGEWNFLRRNYENERVVVTYRVRQRNTYELQGRPGSERSIVIEDDPTFSFEIGDAEPDLRRTVELDWENRKRDTYDDEVLRDLYGRGAGYGRIVREGFADISGIRVI